ncbi:MAG TPA: hypothetical protein VGF45_20870, partial [Polyangia bacterium]
DASSNPADGGTGFPFDLPGLGAGGMSTASSGGSGGNSVVGRSGGSGGASLGGAGGQTGTAGQSGSGGQGGGTVDAARADSSSPEVGVPPAPLGVPSATWQETWFEHVEPLKLNAHDAHAVVYFDGAVTPATAAWVQPFLAKVWKYAKDTYGAFGTDPRVYLVAHQGTRYPGSHSAGYQDASHGNRNVLDFNQMTWTQTPAAMNALARVAASIVESHNNGIRGNPGFGIWGFKLRDLFEYDFYVGVGMTTEAKATYDRLLLASDSSPRAGTFWYRDWFLPLWNNYGKARLMPKFFSLLAQHYPKVSDGAGRRYDRSLNFGEYVHFMSGAAGTNLKSLATQAFGWTADMEAQFTKARSEFAGVTY